MKNFLKAALALAALVVSFSSPAFAVNKIPLKPDAANAAPVTICGGSPGGISIGKTTCPTEISEVQGNQAISGRLGVGLAPAATAAVSILAANASSTGTVIASAPSPTADIVQVKQDSTLVMKITPDGLLQPRQMTLAQIQAFTPLAGSLGAWAICTNCANPYSVCRSTGAVVQGFSIGASGSLAECK